MQPTIHQILGGTPLAMHPGIELPASPFTAHYSYPVVIAKSGTVATNVAGGPYLVDVKGAVAVGRTPTVKGGSYGSSLMVVRIKGKPGEHETVTFSTASSTPEKVGLVITLLSLAALVVLCASVFIRERRRGRRHP